MINNQTTIRQIDCLLFNNFSLLSCSSAIEAFEACNRLSGEQRYQINYLGFQKAVRSDTNLTIHVDINLSTTSIPSKPHDRSMLLICGGSPALYPNDKDIISELKKVKSRYQRITGVGTGSYCLARAGWLHNRKASVHWWSLSQLRSQFPDIYFSTDLFSIDGPLATCRGGSSALDLSFILIGQDYGPDMVEALSQYFLKERIGATENSKRITLSESDIVEHPKLAEAILLMENNIDEPLSTDDIACHISLSKRQLERLFKKHLTMVPSRYYLLIRLEKARTLLLESPLPVTSIALQCGFSSAAHFSTSYRNVFGLTPTEQRVMKH